MKNLNACSLAVLRVIVAIIFFVAGLFKLRNMDMAKNMFTEWGFPGFVGPLIGIIEVVAAILLLLGLFNRWVNYVLMAIMVVAILAVKVRYNMGWQAMQLDFLLLASAFALSANGPGSYALKLNAKKK